MPEPIIQSLVLIINTLGGLYLLAILLRFLLQVARADFYNPVSQAIVKVTSPLLMPLRKVIPGIAGIDFASVILAILLNTLLTALIIFISEPAAFPSINPTLYLIWGTLGAVSMLLKIYFYGLIIVIVASFFAPHSGNPALLLIQQLLHPLQSRVRKLLPVMGGLDFSPILIFMGLRILDNNLLFGFAQSLRLPFPYVIGI